MQRRSALLTAIFLLALASPDSAPAQVPLERIKLPPGFRIELYAEGVEDARSLALGSQGVVFVGTRRAGKVYALVDAKRQNRADRVVTVASGLRDPNGVAFKDGALYVAERSRILRFPDIEKRLDSLPSPAVLRDDYPTAPGHGWKFIAFGPDGWLYVPVGAPCNVCPRDGLYASITRLSPDFKTREIYARGIRNTVGFDWHPKTRELWFTDNGRDYLGDDLPDDELNHAPRAGMDFGFPYCHATGAKSVPDPQLNGGKGCGDFTPPAAGMGAHVAAIGMRFYTGSMFPPEYQGNIFIAEHGSWNRSAPSGYRVVRVKLDAEGQKVASQEVFASGWLPGGSTRAWGRPVDVLVMPDGALLVSDDEVGAVYRISHSKR